MSRSRDVHDATASRFLDERGSSSVSLAPNGLNPASVMEKAVRDRVVNSMFFQDVCFGLNEADVVSRAVEHVAFVGGTYGAAQTPSPFLCLAFKLLQLQPEGRVVREYMSFGGEKFKYLRALGCFYWRLTRGGKECYEVLEEYLGDGRKLRRKWRGGTRLGWVDEFVDELLTKDRVCGTSLFKIPRRQDLEDMEVLGPRVSRLGDVDEVLEALEEGSDEEEDEDEGIKGRDGGEGAGSGSEKSRGKRRAGSEDGEMEENSDDEYERRKQRRMSE
ncbi:hypothetical protein MKZ38_002483 [Zalerion maritima]|uniref:Pre-mRNA-splicing factor 38 n=1 Tax=Zalerion maritima TaxID=339359 RepID=A0AAD5WSG0_9PEZI|nr:hypothetical protein MKZ38_002483 [Zalerion maritima]